MEVNVRLFATLREGRDKTLSVEIAHGAVVRDLITSLAIAEADVAILLVNGKDATLETVLAPDDTVSIFPPVGGG